MADNPLAFVLDLDSQEFNSGLDKALATVLELGKGDQLKGLISMLGVAGEALGAVALVAGTFKAALNLTEEGEELQRTIDQFNMLGEQAGIATDILREGMEKASRGLLTTNEQLQIANKALVTMGADAARLPEIMDLARKATLVFGGDFKTNLDQIAMALETGNIKMLKHLGLRVDAQKAEQKLAADLGLTVEELSQANKQHAIMNAVLEEGKERFKAINADQERTVDLIKEIKVAFSEMGESIALLWNATLGPVVKYMVQGFADMAKHVKALTFSAIGNDAQKAAADFQLMSGSIDKSRARIRELHAEIAKSKAAHVDPAMITSLENEIKLQERSIQANLKKNSAILHSHQELKRTEIAADKEEEKEDDLATQRKLANQDAIKKKTAQVNAELLKMDQDRARLEEQFIQHEDQIDELLKKRKELRHRQHLQRIAQIEAQWGRNSHRSKVLQAAEDKRFEEQERVEAMQTEREREKLMEEYGKTAKNVFQGIERAGKHMALTAKNDLHDMGKQGNMIMEDMRSHSVNAFASIGEGIASQKGIAEATADAMKSAFFGMIGDVAIQYGSMLIAEGVGSFDPIPIAAGGALVALGTMLKTMGGSSGGVSVGGGYSGGGGDVGSPSVTPTSQVQTTQADLAPQQNPQRSVNINIQGHYLNTQESQRTLMEIMRAESDATDFKYSQIGVR